MDPRKFKFLVSVLGADGAKALAKAAERSQELENALLPRTILAWLGIAARSDYEGGIPGVDNTYIQFQKSEDKFTGSISIGDDIYSFEDAALLHMASAVAVALGQDHERVSPGLRDMDIQRLGKNIDTLVKARVAVAELRKMRVEPQSLNKMAIAALKPGDPIERPDTTPSGTKMFDYTHLLQPYHQKAGYQLQVSHTPASSKLKSHLLFGGRRVGGVEADHEGNDLKIDFGDIHEDHRGKGLGQAAYEAVMAHGFHKLGVKNVTGDVHSTMASKVHQRLGQKHGMNYKPTPTPYPQLAAPRPGPFDAQMGPYNYAIKEELAMGKAAKSPSGGAEAPGPAHAPTAPDGPIAPTPPDPTQNSKGPVVGLRPKLPKPPKAGQLTHPLDPKKTQPAPGTAAPASPSLNVTKSQARVRCALCGIPQFKDDHFTGCYCFKAMAKSVKVSADEHGYVLQFKSEWDAESIITLAEALQEKQ